MAAWAALIKKKQPWAWTWAWNHMGDVSEGATARKEGRGSNLSVVESLMGIASCG